MKRIKKFVKDNKNELIVGTYCLLTGAVIAMAYSYRKDMRGMIVNGAETWKNTDGAEILVMQTRNGKFQYLDKVS